MSNKKEKLTNIFLVGSLGTRFGKKWSLNVKSIPEALRAINVNTKNKLFEYLSGDAKSKLYKIAVGKKQNVIPANEASNRSGNNNIYIIPTVAGADSGLGKILAGIAIIGLAVVTGGLAGVAIGAKGLVGALLLGAVGVGVSLVLGGVVQLLTPVPKFDANEEATARSSVFQGNSVGAAQGGTPSVIYGRALVSPMPISISINNNDVSTTKAGAQGIVERTNLAGGGYEYYTRFAEETVLDI